MEKVDVQFLQSLIREYGVRDTITGLVEALRVEADALSDLSLKEKSVQAADMADVLQELNGD